jgi:type IV pilus assembly protein PilY1
MSAKRSYPALLGALLTTLLASNAQAVSFPPVPLESGAQFPPPNVRFILDDSGSMNFAGMPENLQDPADASNYGAGVRNIDFSLVSDASALHNSIYYNPAVTYRPWMQANATRYANASYASAARSLTGLGDLVDLGGAYQTFYTPKVAGNTSTANADNYRWQIVPASSTNALARGRIVRSEWLAATDTVTTPAGFPKTGLSNTTNGGSTVYFSNQFTFAVPAGLTSMVVTLSGGNHGDNGGGNNGNGRGADLLVDDDADLTNDRVCTRTGDDNNETCTIANPAAQNWTVGIYRDSRYSGVAMTVQFIVTNASTGVADAGCSTTSGDGWRNCAFLLPSTRTEADEKVNYANWYTYHRTRMKVAKAGASEAFSQVGEDLRIGFDSINRATTGIPYDIPVGTDDGLFRDANKTNWYAILHAAGASGGTPLHRGLLRAGKYFSDTTSATSPWKSSTTNNMVACRQNFAILTTDGYWNSFTDYTGADKVGDADGTAGPATITGSKGQTYTYAVANPFQDDAAQTASHRTDTLADVAMHYWKTDLTDLTNNVPVTTDDPAFWQHMVTFGVSIGLNGTLNPGVDLPALKLGSKKWPDVRADSAGLSLATRIDDLWHASINGRGSFTVANNTDQFARGLGDAFLLVAARQGSASNVTANSTSFTADTRVFQASYVSGRWNGELLSYDATSAGVGSTPLWKASDGLAGTRKFFTWNSVASAGATFPTAAQTTALDASSRSVAPVNAANNIAYLKGTRTMERQNNGPLRDRTSALGDIVNSSPFYVKDTNSIYVGANDGMLHAFDAANGQELFAYFPKGINYADLSALSSPNYVHRYFVDGPVVVTTRAQTPGANYLVGSLGRGGKGLFGLDVTAPSAFDATKVLWELTHADLGNVLGEPLIATTNDANKKVAIVGNGLNSTGGSAVLFVVDLATGAVLHRLDTGATGDNGLFAPRGWDNDGNGTVDFVYAGDRLGNLWKFDFTGATPSIALGGEPLFTTQSGQPITTGVAVARDPSTSKRWVFVGTGSYMTSTDPADATVQSVYAIIDNDAEVARSELQERDILVSTLLNGRRVRGFEANATLDGAKKGWYVDLDTPAAGERVVTRPQVRGSVLVFSSRTPPTDNTCDAGGAGFLNGIDAFSGTSTSQPYFDGNKDGSINDSDRVTSGGTTVPVGSIDLGIGMPTLPTVIDQLIVVGGSTGSLGSIKINPLGGVARRASWHEIEGD